jgi:hypothetical protein
MKRFLAALALGSVCGCAPLTFSDPGAIDFSRYRSVLVTGDGADYLAAELVKVSGFASVTTETASVDLVLDVSVTVAEDRECECEWVCDDDIDELDDYDDDDDVCVESCSCESWFDATAAFVATASNGEIVDLGTESDTSGTEGEAFEDVLDEVAFHYVRAYRL